MNTKLQIIVAALVIAGLIYLIYLVRTRALQLRYALGWMAAGLVVLILDIFPPLIKVLANLFGIGKRINMLFFLGFLFSLGLTFVLTVAISRNSIRIKELSQEIALRDAKIYELLKLNPQCADAGSQDDSCDGISDMDSEKTESGKTR